MKKINLAITGCMGRMGQQIIKSVRLNKNFKIAKSIDVNQIYKISDSKYKDSRYYFDQNFDKKKVQEFYNLWLYKAVKNLFDNLCLIYFRKNIFHKHFIIFI